MIASKEMPASNSNSVQSLTYFDTEILLDQHDFGDIQVPSHDPKNQPLTSLKEDFHRKQSIRLQSRRARLMIEVIVGGMPLVGLSLLDF